MARRRRQSTAEDIMDLVALLPWWAGVALALVAWIVFRSFANGPAPTLHPGQVHTSFILGASFRAISTALQYVAPLLCLAGALGSYLRRRKRASLVESVTSSRSADALNGMSWREFEMLVSEAFRLQGYSVQEQGGAQPDGGVDLVARKGTETFLVQCKQWKALKVGVDVVRQLYGVMAARGAAGGFVVTSGRFTEDAVAFAAGRNVRLVDGPKLFGWLQQARTSLAARASAPSLTVEANRPDAVRSSAPAVAVAPSCPVCSAAMVRRTARKGTNAGLEFWGCSTFPKCRGTR